MTINPRKIYLVYAQENVDYPDGSWVVATFGTEEEAKHYVDIYNQLEEDSCGYVHFYEEKELDTFDLNTKVAEYYCYCADVEWDTAKELRKRTWIPEEDRLCLSDKELEEKYNHPDNNRIHDDEKYKKIDKGETYIDITEYGGAYDSPKTEQIEVYSKNSLEEARTICLDLWNKKIKEVKERVIS